jgi:heat-inducible transcriptional repressor
MNLGERQKRILRAVIDRYIESAEPVGSKAIAHSNDLNLSSATIRNEMSELETLGLLEQPHTSAGRVPTPQGYRVYVNELMQQYRLTLAEVEEINRALSSRLRQLDNLLENIGSLTARLTSYPALSVSAPTPDLSIVRFDLIHVDAGLFIIVVMLSNKTVKNKLVNLPHPADSVLLAKVAAVFNAHVANLPESDITPSLIASIERALGDTQGIVAIVASYAIEILSDAKHREAHISGTTHLFEHPEYRDIEKAQRLMRYLSADTELKHLPSPDFEDAGSMKIIIGPENLVEELKDTSVIVARYDAGDDMQGLIGIIGPTRMDYSRMAARLSFIAQSLSRLLRQETPHPMLGRGQNFRIRRPGQTPDR